MRRYSPKRQAQMREWGPKRKAYREEHGRCMNCGAMGTDVHEIASGCNRHLSYQEPATWLLGCNGCNCEEWTDKVKWPVARQLALKLLCDPERFDLEKFNAVYLGTVTLKDVAQWLMMTA